MGLSLTPVLLNVKKQIELKRRFLVFIETFLTFFKIIGMILAQHGYSVGKEKIQKRPKDSKRCSGLPIIVIRSIHSPVTEKEETYEKEDRTFFMDAGYADGSHGFRN